MESSITENSAPVSASLDFRTKLTYRNKSLSNLLKMGHCAPAVMKSYLDLKDTNKEWLVRMTAGLPGGIGNTGYECGGITSPLIQFGLEKGLSSKQDGIPTIIYDWHEYSRQFVKCNGSLLCKEILGDRRVPLPCIKVVRHAPEIYKQTNSKDNGEAVPEASREAFSLLYSHLSANDFHCAHAVLNRLEGTIQVTQELLDGTSGFIGGTAFKGLTCSAFTGGVMAVGLKLGEIENSFPRVVRMLTTMIAGGNAMADNMNKFNRLLNIGYRMSKWFKGEFGSTLCSEITQCNFSSPVDVNRYIEKGGVAVCKNIAQKVADHAAMVIRQNGEEFLR